MGSSLPPPPKWGPANPYPKTAADWLSFVRWLLQLYKATQSQASLPPFTGPAVSPQPRPFDVAQALALGKVPYPLRQVPTLIEDTHAHRTTYPAASYPDWLYFETDTLVLYVSVAGFWQYAAGSYSRTQAQLAAYAATLGVPDAGTLAWVSDYAHMLKWTGAAWTRGPGDPEHSDTFWAFGAAPSDTGWHACDGTVGVHFLKYDGTLGTRTLPNTAGGSAYMLLGAAYSATITAATVPIFAGALDTTSAVSAGTPAGTVSQPTFTGNTLANHHHDAPVAVVGTTGYVLNIFGVGGNYSAQAKFTVAADSTGSLSGCQTSTESIGLTPAGTVSQPTFTGNALGTHSHTVTPTGTISLPADPIAWFAAILFYRQ